MTEPESQPTLAGPAAGDFLRLGSTATTFAVDAGAAKEQFRRFHALHVRGVLEPGLLATMLRLCQQTTWVDLTTNCTFRQNEEPPRAGLVLSLALNRAENLRWLEDVTECGPLSHIDGRLARNLHRPGDQLTWHDDNPHEGRRLAIVINLSTDAYAGGEFEMRRKNAETLFQHRYTEVNSALIFKVDRGLEHRVLPLTAGGPRRIFAGWAFARS